MTSHVPEGNFGNEDDASASGIGSSTNNAETDTPKRNGTDHENNAIESYNQIANNSDMLFKKGLKAQRTSRSEKKIKDIKNAD